MNILEKLELSTILELLSEQESDAVVMWYVQDYSLKEIADLLNEKYELTGAESLKSRKVRLIIAKSMEKLRENLKD
jgi:DNA-directed RNA polymerase specialized sigma24 family protein